LTSNRIKNIKDIKFINLHLIITKCLSPENIDLQESVLFYYLKRILQQLKPGKSLESHENIRILVAIVAFSLGMNTPDIDIFIVNRPYKGNM
jgi:hypothetical protein